MRQHSDEYLRRFGKRRNRLITFMVGLFLVCAAFLAGFLVRGNVDFLSRLGFETAANSQDANPGMTISGETYDSLAARMAEVQGIFEQNSQNSYDLDATTAQMLEVLTQATGDPYVSYLDESHYEAYLSAVTDSYRSIGVLFSEVNGQAYAVDVYSGSEAEAKGVRAGDFVVAIDGDRGTDGWTQAEVVRVLGNADGESVVITWRRPPSIKAEGGDEFTTELKVSDVEEPNVQVELIDGQVGYIKLAQITSNSDRLVSNAIEKLKEQGATCYVFDLRDNPGGYLTQAIDIASLFVSDGTLVTIQTNDGDVPRDVSSNIAIEDAPTVILVNAKTAAAAEVIAGGLQDLGNGRIRVVGETTMGKGSVQAVTQLSFGGGLRYTTGYYKTPSGYEIDGNGIVPDVQVAAGSSPSEDAQKALAVDTAKAMVASE